MIQRLYLKAKIRKLNRIQRDVAEKRGFFKAICCCTSVSSQDGQGQNSVFNSKTKTNM